MGDSASDESRFDDGDSKIGTVAEEIIRSFLFAADRPVAGDDYAAIGESALLIDVIVGPTGSVELREHVLSTSVGFGK